MAKSKCSGAAACSAYQRRKIFGVIYQDHVIKNALSFTDAMSYIGQFLVEGQRAYIYDSLTLAVWLLEMKDNKLHYYDGEVCFSFMIFSDDFYHFIPDYVAAPLNPWEV